MEKSGLFMAVVTVQVSLKKKRKIKQQEMNSHFKPGFLLLVSGVAWQNYQAMVWDSYGLCDRNNTVAFPQGA